MERSLGVFFLIQKCYLEAGPREVGAAQGVEVPFVLQAKGNFEVGGFTFVTTRM
jgi:hypothetical protein